MIFNTLSYYLLFLFPSVLAFQVASPKLRPFICVSFGCVFFVFFALTAVGGVPGAFCLGVFLWEAVFSRFYKRGSWLCWVGVFQSIGFLVVFKYWNFIGGLYFGAA